MNDYNYVPGFVDRFIDVLDKYILEPFTRPIIRLAEGLDRTFGLNSEPISEPRYNYASFIETMNKTLKSSEDPGVVL